MTDKTSRCFKCKDVIGEYIEYDDGMGGTDFDDIWNDGHVCDDCGEEFCESCVQECDCCGKTICMACGNAYYDSIVCSDCLEDSISEEEVECEI